LRAARERILAIADVVPGHGEPFVPSDDTVR